MKKLMTLLSAATVALGLYAYNDTGTSFEGASEGAFLLNTADDLPLNALGNHTDLWATNGVLELNVISNATACPPHAPVGDAPDQFTREPNYKYLSIKSTFGNQLTRYVKTGGQTESIGSGLYFDSMVKFTAFDQDPTNIAAIATEFADAKIAVWVQTTEDESATNLYVWAGQFYGDAGATRGVAYKCSNIDDVDAWHRLTIKAIGDIYPGVDQVAPGFVVYVDGHVVGRQNDAAETGIEIDKLGNSYRDLFLNLKSVYPSLRQGSAFANLASATFDGQGEIDDVVFTATAPDFAKDKDYGEVNWDIADFASVKVDGTEYLNDGKYLTDLTGGYSNVTFNVEYAYGKSGPATQSFTFAPGAMGPFTLTASDAAAVVVVGNVTNSCVDATAIANALKAGVTGDDQAVVTLIDDVGELSLDGVAGRVKIDLNGQEVAGITAPNGVWIYDSSASEGAAVGRVTSYSAFNDNDRPSIIEAGWFDDDVVFGSGSIISNGYFKISGTTTKAALDPYAKGGYEFTEAAVGTLYEGYLILTEQQQGTVFTVTLTWGANETPVLYQINEYTPVPISGATSPLVISDVGSGTNVSFIVANADGAKKGYDVTVAGADAAIDATGATFGWPEYLGDAVNGAYEIDSTAEFILFQKGVAAGLATAGEVFKQTADVDLTDVDGFTGVGTTNTDGANLGVPFAGTYDGQGHKIANVKFSWRKYAGIFNQVNGATIQNLTGENLGFSETGSGEHGCAMVGNGVATLVALKSQYTGGFSVTNTHNAGGIMVRAMGGTTFNSCTNTADLVCCRDKMGGICCFDAPASGQTVAFVNCVNTGSYTLVTPPAASSYNPGSNGFAGILGYSQGAGDTTFQGCENTGAFVNELDTTLFSNVVRGGEILGFCHSSGTISDLGGNKFNAANKAVDSKDAGTVAFTYAMVDNGVATTVGSAALVKDTEYLVVWDIAAGTAFTLQAAGDTIAFDNAFGYTFGGTVDSDAALGVSSATAGTVTTYTAFTAVAKNGENKYATFKAAVDAAQAGDMVVVLANCTVDASVSFTKNITVSNDYTIAANVNYALCIGATVTFEGSGEIKRKSGITGSPLCVGANEATRGTITVGTAGALIFNGGTVSGGSGGNLIKLENGTVTMNGGILTGGQRGIKADADAGNYTSAIVINGGTITNNSECAVNVSAESADGTATIVVNGGVIAGALTYGKTTGTHSITIPGTSTAKFDRDQSAFCASGYATTLSDGWYVVGPATYTITFEAGANATVDPATTNYTINSGAITLPTAVPTGVGVTFGGWTNETITTAIKTYTPAVGDGDFTLYAKWDAVVGPTYPTYLENADADVKAQYLAWKELYGADTGSAYEGEFLLNVAPDTTGATLDATAVSISGTTVTIDINRGNLNGVPYVKKASTVAGLATAPKAAITIVPADQVQDLDNGGRITLTGESGTTMFYQIGVQSTPLNQN